MFDQFLAEFLVDAVPVESALFGHKAFHGYIVLWKHVESCDGCSKRGVHVMQDLGASDGRKSSKKHGLKAKLNSATRKLIHHNKRGADRSSKVEVATKNVGIEILEPTSAKN